MTMGNNEKATVDISKVDRLAETLQRFGDQASVAVSQYLAEDGYRHITESITRLLPVSGRRWSGKPAGARSAGAAVFGMEQTDLMSITVRSVKPYNYLYFPDDGSNTKRHAGRQHFMQRGAEASTDSIVDGICTRLVELFEEGV